MRKIAILGATGSVGTQALDVVRQNREQFHPVLLTARSSSDALFRYAREFGADAIALEEEPKEIPSDIRTRCACFFGRGASERALEAVKPDDVLAAIVGIAGLNAVMAACGVCERVLLANKEALVTGGELVKEKAARRSVALLPVDSEHSAIFQCLQGRGGNEPERLILTASGGPFRTWEKERIHSATARDALGHPTWNMGAKITVDSASLMNKGLEVIEAKYLFDMAEDKIAAVVHPQSIVHSMVEYKDGAVLAQLGVPDMRGAIGYAMGYPQRIPYGGKRLSLEDIGSLTFEKIDADKFPCYEIARQALREGGNRPVVMNGANESAVAAFLEGRIPFGAISEIVSAALERVPQGKIASVSDVWECDRASREAADRILQKGK